MSTSFKSRLASVKSGKPAKYFGFTGTREGMTNMQAYALKALLLEAFYLSNHETVLLHGDCVGSDETAHKMATDMGMDTWAFPPNVSALRAMCAATRMELPQGYLERNRQIVNNSDLMVAVTKTAEQELRSGTWATARYALGHGKTVIQIPPDGGYKWL